MTAMTEFTRLTVIGSARKADLVVPNDEAVAGLMPRLMDLLDEPTGSVVRPLTLVRTTGEQLDAALTIADQQVSDGELLRLVRSGRRSAAARSGRCDRCARRVIARSSRTLVEVHPRAHWLCRHWGTELRARGSAARGPAAARRRGRGPVVDVGHRRTSLAALDLRGRHCRRARRSRECRLAVQLSAQPCGTAPAPATVIMGLAVLGWLCLGLGFGQGLRSRPAWLGGLVGVPISALPLIMVALGSPVATGRRGDRCHVGCGVRRIATAGAGRLRVDRS